LSGIYQFDPEDAKRFGREQGIEYRVRGNELQFKRCPYCRNNTNDKDTFAISLETGQFKCLRATCGATGNMITLAKDFNFSLGNDVDEYYQRKRKFRSLRKYSKPVTRPAAVEYLESRGISPGTTEKFNITTQKDDESVIVFPFHDENDVLQFVKYRNTDQKRIEKYGKEFSERDCKPILFGMNLCKDTEKPLILTEGQIDSLSVTEAGIENAVSVPNGAKGFTWVPYCWDFLSKFKELIVFGDYEKGHITLLEEMTGRFHGIIRHIRPEDYLDCKDANELLVKHGKQAIRDAIQNAVIVDNPKIIRLVDVQRKGTSEMVSISTGFKQIDDKLGGGFFLGQLIIITGKRGLGKSTLGSQFGIRAISEGHTVMFYSGELNDWMFKDWFERQAAGKNNINVLQGGRSKEYSVEANAVSKIEHWYEDKAYFYDNSVYRNDTESTTEEESLLKTLETAITQYGCKVLLIDNLMTAIVDDLGNDLYRLQTLFVKELAIMAKRYEVLIILIVHPRKSNESSADCDAVMGSSNITNLADVVLNYGEPKKDQKGDRVLHIWKNRLNGNTDREGLPLWYESTSKRISALEGLFDWNAGWEDEKDFEPVPEDEELPFGTMED
jgi:archaellum biogenesis ATPase FlaH